MKRRMLGWVLMTALAATVTTAAHAQKSITIGGDDNYSSQSMTVGDTLVIKLRVDRSSGYSWAVAPGTDPVLTEAPGGARNTPGMQTFRFTAANSGIVTLTLNNVKKADTMQAHPVQTYQVMIGVNSRPGEAKPGVVIGHFRGEMPCADCPGITEDIVLYAKGANELVDTIYTSKLVYQGKQPDTTFEDKGNWVLLPGTATDPSANVYQLTNSKGAIQNYWLRTTDELIPLDMDKKPMEGPAGKPLVKVAD